jgi:hypothetical protein
MHCHTHIIHVENGRNISDGLIALINLCLPYYKIKRTMGMGRNYFSYSWVRPVYNNIIVGIHYVPEKGVFLKCVTWNIQGCVNLFERSSFDTDCLTEWEPRHWLIITKLETHGMFSTVMRLPWATMNVSLLNICVCVCEHEHEHEHEQTLIL